MTTLERLARILREDFEVDTAVLGRESRFGATTHFPASKLRMLDRTSQLALLACAQAVQDAGAVLEERVRAGVSIGTGMGGAQSMDDGYRSLYGELAGYGVCTDCGHITRPGVEGQAQAMRAALASAGMPPEAIGYVNAHGTGTLANEAVETRALRAVFGTHAERIPVSSTKSTHGHLLGAAGALELVAALLVLTRGVAPPTMHLRVPDAQCDLDYVPNEARTGLMTEAVMSSSFAFGGTNAVLIARAAPALR